MYKIDLHTHSTASPDGALTLEHYKRMLESGNLDYIAITDHNTIDFALQALTVLEGRIIIGEEITAAEGEVIGLYLQEAVPPGLSLADTIKNIHQQGGLVYIPHPFETVRKGLPAVAMDPLAEQIDIVEIYNGRAVFQNRSSLAAGWAARYKLPGAASSDTHGWHGWGKTYTIVEQVPDVGNLASVLSNAQYKVGSPGLRGVLYPKLNRLKRLF